jgi:hypothetical protein
MVIHADWPFVAIHWEPVVQAVWMQWRTATSGEPFHRAMDVGLNLLEQRHAKNWLADLRCAGIMTRSDRMWMNQNWFPRAARSGLSHVALVSSRASVPKLTVSALLENDCMPLTPKDSGVTTAYFQNTEAGLLWLRRLSNPNLTKSMLPRPGHAY